jgi:hypothetical protein
MTALTANSLDNKLASWNADTSTDARLHQTIEMLSVKTDKLPLDIKRALFSGLLQDSV